MLNFILSVFVMVAGLLAIITFIEAYKLKVFIKDMQQDIEKNEKILKALDLYGPTFEADNKFAKTIYTNEGIKLDSTLAEDEWWAVFYDYQDVRFGTLSKQPWGGGSNMTAVFKVKRVE